MTAIDDVDRLVAVRATGLLDTGAEESFDRLARLACRLLEVPHAFVTVVDDTRSFWKSCIGVDASLIVDRQNPVEESFCQYVIRSNGPLIVDDARLDEVTRHNPSIEKMGVLAWAGHPLRSAAGQVLGTFCVVDVIPREWTASQLETLAVIAAAIESEIRLRTMLDEAASAETALREEMYARERLAALAEALAAAVTTDDVAAAITVHGPMVMQSDFAIVGVIDADRRSIQLHPPAGLDPDLAHKYSAVPLDAVTPISDAARTGIPVFLADRGAHHPRYDHLLDDAAAASVTATAAIALRRNDGTVAGTLGVGWARPQQFTRATLATLTTVAVMSAQALERAQLGDERTNLVRSLSQLLLPAVPDIAGIDVAVRYLPANLGLGFGGDWYDIIDLGHDRAAIVIGDIAGHGIQAAASMAQVSSAINALTRIHADDLTTVFAAAETMLPNHDTYIATAAIYILDTRTGRLDYVCAGHPPAIIVHPDSTSELLTGGHRALLGQGGRPSSVGTTVLPPGSVLIAYTDGLIEDRQSTIDDGIERLINVSATALHHASLDAAVDQIIPTMLRGRTTIDDIALITTRRQP